MPEKLVYDGLKNGIEKKEDRERTPDPPETTMK